MVLKAYKNSLNLKKNFLPNEKYDHFSCNTILLR